MIWENLKEGIHFENSSIFLPWNEPMEKIQNMGNPTVNINGGRLEIIWTDQVLLQGLNGYWMTSCMDYEEKSNFKFIELRYVGDKESKEAYEYLKEHLFGKIGEPDHVNENADEKELKWVNGNCYIRLYFFEMHAFRCDLTVGVKG